MLLEGPNPEHWGLRSSVCEQFERDNYLSAKELNDSVFEIQGQGIDPPLSIAMIILPNVGELFETSNRLRNIPQIWQASKLALCDPSDGALLELEGASRDAEKFIERIKGGEFRRAKLVRKLRFNLKIIRKPHDIERLCQAAKLRDLRRSNFSRT